MLRTRSNPNTSAANLSPGPTQPFEPDTPSAHYDNRTHEEIDPLADVPRRMSLPNEGLATRRGGKGMLLSGLNRLQSLAKGEKGKGKAQYRLGMFSYFEVGYDADGKDYHIELGYW